MSVIRLPIDVKSFYFNIKNDNETGHTATVATPLKQGESIHKELSRIRDIPENISSQSRERLIGQLLSNSRVQAKITDVFVFDKISVNGISISCDSSFCIYIREETDPDSFHFGRQKVHYPYSFKYTDAEVEINNRKVMDSVSAKLNGYAYIVEAFEYAVEDGTLNLDAIIVGENGIPYSKVFLNKKGVGNKFTTVFNEFSDTYDAEIIALREKFGYGSVTPENYLEFINSSKNIATDIVVKELFDIGIRDIRNLSEEYPYSLYDFEYSKNGMKYFLTVRFTSTKIKYFCLPFVKRKFCADFPNTSQIVLVTDVNGNAKTYWYSADDLNRMNKSINSITFTVGGE